MLSVMCPNRLRVVVAAGAAASSALLAGCGEERLELEGGGGRSAIDSGRSVQGGNAAAGNGAAGTMTGSAPGCDSVSSRVLAEELPDPDAPLTGIVFDGDVAEFVDQALERRYPFGLELVRGGRMETVFGDCSVVFAGEPESAREVYESIEVIVHECGHLYDGFLTGGGLDAYVLTAELSFRCGRGDSTRRRGDTFARSRIARDEYAALRPPCNGVSRADCDPYADVYLNGDPDDDVFDSGDQGFNLLMEEAVQYVNSLATAWTFVDRQPANVSVSARDGILTFLWYIERYLRVARLEQPAAYARLAEDECWRELTLGVWARAQRFLALSAGDRRLGIADAQIAELVRAPELLEEIERLRALEPCP